jgi:hypothetical protein
MACECDYSYICHECQLRIDIRNQEEYNDELKQWTVEAIRLIAQKLNIEIPDPPARRWGY